MTTATASQPGRKPVVTDDYSAVTRLDPLDLLCSFFALLICRAAEKLLLRCNKVDAQ